MKKRQHVLRDFNFFQNVRNTQCAMFLEMSLTLCIIKHMNSPQVKHIYKKYKFVLRSQSGTIMTMDH